MAEFITKQRARKTRTRNKRRIILIGCEGNNKTEKNYFSSFNNIQNEYKVQFSSGNDTDLTSMLYNIKKSKKAVGFDSKTDISFAVFDIDNNPYKIKLYENIKKSKDYFEINFIVSNPCFELWYLLHFLYSTKIYNSSLELINELNKFIPNYDKNKDYFDSLFSTIEKAVENNKKLISNAISTNSRSCIEKSYTNVVEIVEILFKAVNISK